MKRISRGSRRRDRHLEVMALVYLCDEYKLHSDASEDSAAVVTVPSGQMVEILDVTVDEDGQVWEKVSTDMSGTDYIGYVRRDYLACSDERFLEWEEYYGMNPGGAAMLAADGQGNYADIEQFPAGYQPALTALKEKYPNWIFVRYNTELDWNTAVTNEMQGGRSVQAPRPGRREIFTAPDGITHPDRHWKPIWIPGMPCGKARFSSSSS